MSDPKAIQTNERLASELEAALQLIGTVKDLASRASSEASTALARSQKVLIGSDPLQQQKNQIVNLPTLFGISNDPAIKSRSITFLVGAKGFLGYVNDANGSFYGDKEVTEDPQGLAQYEVVNYRTMMSKLREITLNLPNTYLKKEGDAALDNAKHTFSHVIFRGLGRKVYYRTTNQPEEHADHEIVNKAILVAAIQQATNGAIGSNGGTVKQLIIQDPPTNPNHAVRMVDISTCLRTTGGTVEELKVSNPPSESNDVVRLQDLQTANIPLYDYPAWASGKLSFGVDFVSANNAMKATSAYTIRKIDTTNQTNELFFAKILSLDSSVAVDNSDINFQAFCNLKQRQKIAGHTLPGTESRLPYPIDYMVYLEVDMDSSELSAFFDMTAGKRVRIPISSSTNTSSNFFIYSLGIDKDGDLAIIFRSNGTINVPWRSEPISIHALEKCSPRFYISVNSWSYYPQSSKYPLYDRNVPALSLINHTFKRFSNDPDSGAGKIVRTFGLYATDLFDVQWVVNSSTGGSPVIKQNLQTGVWYCEVEFPNNFANSATEESAIISLSATGRTLNGASWSSAPQNVTVTLLKEKPSNDGLMIVSSDFEAITHQLVGPFDLSFSPVAIGGEKPYSFSIDPDETTLENAMYEPRLRLVSGRHDGVGSKVVSLVVTDANGTSFTKNINITVSNSSASTNCFGEDTYVLTTIGAVKFKNLTLKHVLVSLNEEDHTVGHYSSSISPVTNIKVSENAPTVNFHEMHVTPNHRFALSNGSWRELASIGESDSIIACRSGQFEAYHFFGLKESTYSGKLYNLETPKKTYLVSAGVRGPWFLVHNEKIGL